MSIRSLAARGLSFAHLAGLSPRASKAEDDDDSKDTRADDESDDEADNTDRDRDDGDAKKGKAKGKAKSRAKAADEDDDDDQGNDGQKSGKRAEEDDDDEDEEMRGKSAVAQARRREQARCAAIMGHQAGARNVVLAANLAFNTRMGRREAIAVLKGTPAAASPSRSRQARNPNLGSGGEMQRSPAAAAASSWDRAFSKVTGRRAKA